jgi:hypothetical protein
MPTAAFTCPHCSRELQLPDDVWYYTCEGCQARLDLKSQFAFLRGLDAFEEGQELMLKKGPRRKYQKTRENPVYRQVLDLFLESYSSLQVAFAAELAPVQRQVGVEMMASMASEFFRQNMISPFEMAYWSNIMTEQSAQVEYDQLKEKIKVSGSSMGIVMKLRWDIRLAQLARKLPEVSSKINRIEEQIEFIERPHARNRKWKP